MIHGIRSCPSCLRPFISASHKACATCGWSPPPPPSDFSPDQVECLAALESDESVLVTGVAGTGKSFVVNHWLKRCREARYDVAVTASTGIAATHLENGRTLHSWAGMGLGKIRNGDVEATAREIANDERWGWKYRAGARIRHAKAIVLDECFDWAQPILTEKGWQKIGPIVEGERKIRVASRNPDTGNLEFKNILRWIKRPRPPKLLHINIGRTNSTRDGRKIRCTPEHKILTPQGYREAGDLRVGDFVTVRGPGFTPEQMSVLVGSLLGDGGCHQSKKRTSAQVTFTQGQDQKEYLDFKRKVFGSLASRVTSVPSGYENGKQVFRFTLGVTDETSFLRENMLDDGEHGSGRRRWKPTDWFLSLVDEQALAVWFLDNGSTSFWQTRGGESGAATLHTERFTREVNERLSTFLWFRFGIRPVLQDASRGYVFLRFNVEETERLLSIVRRFTPSCMAWKTRGGAYDTVSQEPYDTCYARVRSIGEVSPHKDSLSVYDIEVEDHHNYVAGNVVVSNCSMVPGATLSLFSELCKIARRGGWSSMAKPIPGWQKPFGGIKLVLVGDMGQLEPVESETGYPFETEEWWDCNDGRGIKVVELTKVHRQEEEAFVRILREIRVGNLSEEGRALLEARVRAFDPDGEPPAVRVVTHNNQADGINDDKLDALPGEVFEFPAVEEGDQSGRDAIEKSCLSPRLLRLKVGARVMFTRNDPPSQDVGLRGRFVNGTLGRVTWLSADAVEVTTDDGHVICPDPVLWQHGVDGTDLYMREKWTKKLVKKRDPQKGEAFRLQLPLKLAWAITAHKTQGMTLDRISVDLSCAFASGQTYVALSRSRTLEGLNIEAWNGPGSILVHPEALKFIRGEFSPPAEWLAAREEAKRKVAEAVASVPQGPSPLDQALGALPDPPKAVDW